MNTLYKINLLNDVNVIQKSGVTVDLSPDYMNVAVVNNTATLTLKLPADAGFDAAHIFNISNLDAAAASVVSVTLNSTALATITAISTSKFVWDGIKWHYAGTAK